MPVGLKGAARSRVAQTLQELHSFPQRLAVRMNAIGSGLEEADLSVILPFTSSVLSTLVIPKVSSVSDLESVAKRLPPTSRCALLGFALMCALLISETDKNSIPGLY